MTHILDTPPKAPNAQTEAQTETQTGAPTGTSANERHVLDRPVWSALTGPLAQFGVGGPLARRCAEDVGPLAAARDDSPAALAALAALAPDTGSIGLMQAGGTHELPGLNVLGSFAGVQMVADRPLPQTSVDHPISALEDRHSEAMQDLAALTKPGPFAARTHMLGLFWGIWIDGRLAAMAGERFSVPGYTEISGVCTHPDFRGRGYAKALMTKVAEGISRRGCQPVLHAYADNPAVPFYQELGFTKRIDMTFSWHAKPGAGTAIFGR